MNKTVVTVISINFLVLFLHVTYCQLYGIGALFWVSNWLFYHVIFCFMGSVIAFLFRRKALGIGLLLSTFLILITGYGICWIMPVIYGRHRII